ncbi:MAG: hypothetical protein U0Q16_02065 [Bryobacteraceae bacterium]
MKLLGILAIGASFATAADFTTGQAARLVIGQRTFTAQQPGVTREVLGAVGGVAFANDTLFIVDANRMGAVPINHRVMIYKDLSHALPSPTDEFRKFEGRCPVCSTERWEKMADSLNAVVVGQPQFTTADLKPASTTTLRNPVGVASDGVILVVADTDNNRVLIWNRIPSANGTPADVVVGQTDFTKTLVNGGQGVTPAANSMRGPQGVWLQNGKMFVADSGNNRILIFNSVPKTNGASADVVLGAPDFKTSVQNDLTKPQEPAKANNMRTPVSVTSDGVRLYVTDLGHNRVLIWNSIPTTNNADASVVVGQPDFTEVLNNNSTKLCPATGKDADGKDTFPTLCETTLEYPRFALSDGKYLFISDGGNDRVLVFNSVPTTNGAKADAVIGQIGERVNLISDSADPRGVASSGAVRTPQGLAWDGRNLYVADPFNRRVMVFTIGERKIPNTGVRNAASREVFAVGSLTLSGEVKENQVLKLKVTLTDVSDKEYTYKAKKDDKFEQMLSGLVAAVNAGAGDPLLLAVPNFVRNSIILTARSAGPIGNDVEFTVSVDGDAGLITATSGAKLAGGQDAAQIAPGAVVAIFGENLSEATAEAATNLKELPLELAGVQVYFDGIRAPLYMVSPGEIRAQVPWEVQDAESINAYVRTRRANGEVTVTTAVSVPIVPQNPGIFAAVGPGISDPRPGIVFHGSSWATGTVSVDGSVRAGDIATVVIEDREYSYTVVADDTLESVRDKLINVINQDPRVVAYPAAAFTRIRLRAREKGPAGNGLVYSAKSRDGDQVIMTATTPALCCANEGLVTKDNPALPGETIIVNATGLGLLKNEDARAGQRTGEAYDGPAINDPREFVSSLAGGKTANVLNASLKPGTVGIFEVVLELNSDIPTDEATQLTIAQDVFVSNIITFPVKNPAPTTTP